MNTNSQPSTKVYAAIAGVMADLASTGIAKEQRNNAQNYQFRGIDDVYNALAPILSSRGLVILPRVMARDVKERTSARGGIMLHVSVDVEYDIVSSEDGSRHTVRSAGEAMDSGDKATNKALSAAYKYMAFQTFCIPTEGENDADFESPEIGGAKSVIPQDRLNGMLSEIRTATTMAVLETKYRAYVKGIPDNDPALPLIYRATNARKKYFEEGEAA